jgi:hypothetical protein
MNVMEENNIDVSQLVEYKTDNCQQAEPSAEGGSLPEDIDDIIGELISVI